MIVNSCVSPAIGNLIQIKRTIRKRRHYLYFGASEEKFPGYIRQKIRNIQLKENLKNHLIFFL